MTNNPTEELRDKIEYALADSIGSPAGKKIRLSPVSGMSKLKLDLQIDRIEAIIHQEATKARRSQIDMFVEAMGMPVIAGSTLQQHETEAIIRQVKTGIEANFKKVMGIK